MRIEELVSMDMQGEFRSDVQLSDYEDPKLNRELLQKYIFTVHAPVTIGAAQRDYAAKDVLDTLKTAFTVERGDYRIVLTANYGRGKSHLALALANFFARPADSPEVKIVLDRLGQALNNQSQLAGYRDFKKSKGEFLVVRLQGDRCDDLQEGFVRALEHALQEHNATRSLEMPFWYAHAAAWLKNLSGEARQKAESFLAVQNTDLAHLTSDLRKQGAYALVREVFKQVTGVYPDFGGEVNLEELVLWAVDKVCVPYHFGGLLILFDEFSLFLQKYAASRVAGKLQELLNGISKRPGKSAFLAFSQHDVDTVAETYALGQRRDSVKKELERLPKDKRARLFSLMESVLDAYLKQDDVAWAAWLEQRAVKPALARGREALYSYFSKRYDEALKWNVEAAAQKVVKGCFPLHPLTTAILSFHNFESGAGESPRTALEFVRRMWQDQRQQPAQLLDGSPNFVFAITLVDFFGEQISKSWYTAYRTALESSPIPLTGEHRAVLKALLLQQAVAELDRLKLRKDAQLDLLSHLCGLSVERIKVLLRELSEARVIQYDPYNKISSLLPPGVRSPETEKIIQKAVDETPVDHALMSKISAAVPALEISLNYGNIGDWAPRQAAFTADLFTTDELRKLLQPYRAGVSGIEEGSRGVVIWLIAQSEEEKIQLQQTAPSVLDSALGTLAHPLPVIIVLPKHPTPGLVATAQRMKALETLGRSEREKIGTVMYQQESALAEANFKRAVDEWIGDTGNFAEIQRNLKDYVLPVAYRASVQTLRNLSLKAVIAECYKQAYVYRVDFSDRPVGGKGVNQLRTAVQNIARWLFSDTAGSSIHNLANKDMQYQVANFYLMQKWGLLTTQDYTIQLPTSRALQEAWNLLEETFPAGCNDVHVQTVLLTLLNPPYGHDYNTLTLLLSAWIGFHQHEIRLSLSGKIVSLSQLKSLFDESRNPQDFLNRICILSPLAIGRSKPDEAFNQANTVLEQIRQGKSFSIAEANEALVKLEEALATPRLPEAKREEIEQLRPRLEEALQQAQEYDQRAGAWLRALQSASFDDLLKLRESLKEFPVPRQVMPSEPGLCILQTRWEDAMQTALESFCTRYESLKDLSDYKPHERELQRARKALTEYPMSAKRVEEALDKLKQVYEELKQQESEKAIVAELQRMAPSHGLSTLYAYRERLLQLTNLSPKTSKLRDEKSAQIENRIHQYEQIAAVLPESIEHADSINKLRDQRDLVLRNLDSVQGTPLYQLLCETEQRITQLEAFFEELQKLDRLPCNTPDDLSVIKAQLTTAETHYGALLSTEQRRLLETRKANIEKLHQQKTQEAKTWLQTFAQRHKGGENPATLLQQLEKPPAFLDSESLTRLAQLKQTLQKRLEEDLVAQIEDRFIRIKDIEARRQCLRRLHELMGE